MTTETIQVPTSQGVNVPYYIHPIGTSYFSVPGIYLFVAWSGSSWMPIYIGQTNDLQARLTNHPQEKAARAKGATHILTRIVNTQAERDREEVYLIGRFKPVCNTLLK